jgi:cytochrome c oxidase cbb3-type subunit 2
MVARRAGEKNPGSTVKDAANPYRTVPVVATIVAIAATYGYFLLFAEFALLEVAKPLFGEERELRPLLAVLGASGVIGSLFAAGRFKIVFFRRMLVTGFVGCAVSAGATLGVGRFGLWWAVVGVGLSLGWTAVILSAGLRAVVGAKRLGLWCGLGTGLAYGASNLPLIFEATPTAQTIIAVGFVLLGGLAALAMRLEAPTVSGETDYTTRGSSLWVVIFLALVWLDSAGFYILQHTREMRAQTWSGTWTLYGNALTHLLGAMLAGLALDARRIASTALVALILLITADILLTRDSGNFAGARVFYTIGVSAYSVALVFYPAFGARPRIAAVLFAVAGWLGSALGIGMAQDLHAIPGWFIGLAGTVVLGALLLRRRWLHGSAAGLVVVGLGALAIGPNAVRAEDLILHGREVYIAEGCINCHSQYLRSGVHAEVEWWGPARALSEMLAEKPPLIGLRRQGPDLTNVGNRRSPEWQRLHLIAPGAVSPGTRMPSYAHLFQIGDGRGIALVAYLAELGADTILARQEQIAAWKPAERAISAPFNRAAAQKNFDQLCASCHGLGAQGDGPLAAQLTMKPPDFTRDAWRHLRADEPARTVTVARIIKFGLAGTPMAGREYLDDAAITMLARYVEALHR